jgi:hypothetical protein
MGNIGGIPIEYPVNPYVVSNRLYVNAEIPFVNEKRIIVMSDDMDDLKLPPLWDRNYNADTYEIVTSRTNPVLQVFYTKPNEIHVNAIYVLSPTNILAAWEFRPTIISPRVSFWATNTNTGEVISGTNISSGVFWDTNNVYDLPPLNRATLFKYPSRIYPGISANPPSSLVRRIRRPLMIVLLTIALYLVIDIIKGWRLRSAKN